MDKLWSVLRWVIIVAEVVFIALLICWGISIYNEFFAARADGIQEEVWVLCEPGGVVNLREKPKGEIFGGVQAGAVMWTDGKQKQGFLHVLELPAEESTGWISARYIVYDRPQEIMQQRTIRAEGRVACRTWIGGKVRKWAYDGDVVTVYSMSSEWACTDWGYIRTEYVGEEAEDGSKAA